MALFQGQECSVCKNIFTEKDDVVVCPECGTPHHRACYRQEQGCVNREKHKEGFEWKAAVLPGQEKTAVQEKVCSRCGMENPPMEQVCRHCGQPLAENAEYRQSREFSAMDGEPLTSPYDVYAKRLADMQLDGVPLHDLMIFVRKNPMYFLKIFPYLAQKSALPPVNWAALCFNFFYLFYRKMYKYGAAFLAALILFKLPSFVLMYKVWPQYLAMMPEFMKDISAAYTFVPDFTGLEVLQLLSGIGSYLVFFSSVLCGFIANKLYFHHCISKVKAIRQKYIGREDAARHYQQELVREGSTNAAAVVAVGGLLLIAFYMVVFWIAGSAVV